MISVHKQQFSLERTSFVLELPEASDILKVSTQNEIPTIWYLCPVEAKLEPRNFMIYGTGWEIKSLKYHKYIDTFFTGPYVWHLFETTGWKTSKETP